MSSFAYVQIQADGNMEHMRKAVFYPPIPLRKIDAACFLSAVALDLGIESVFIPETLFIPCDDVCLHVVSLLSIQANPEDFRADR